MNDLVAKKLVSPDVVEDGRVESAELAVRAKCRISVGEVCTVYFPDHCDADSYREHINYHNQNAVVIGIVGEEVNLRMTTGPKTGHEVLRINPMHLFFWGPFVKEPE